MVPVKQPGKATSNFEIAAKYNDTRHMPAQLKFRPAVRRVRHGVMTLSSSRGLFENDVQEEENQFTGELYVSEIHLKSRTLIENYRCPAFSRR